MHRRQFLCRAAQTTLAVSSACCFGTNASRAVSITTPTLTPPDEIYSRVNGARPLRGGAIPADLANRLGATHYAGKYHLTDEPFLLEGCRALHKLGMKVAKLWFAPALPGYSFNSEWKLAPDARLVEVARHPYFQQAFAMPFSAFALEIQPVQRNVGFERGSDFSADEQQFYELARHLLQTYAGRDVTFLLQHWEGDWMFRGRAGGEWTPPANIQDRADAFVRWLTARQSGVNRARAEAGETRCRVYHAAEVNRVLDALKGIPTLTTHVLPRVALDWISWSSYDGMGSVADTWHGLELIRQYALPAPGQKEPRIFIGEIGLPEQGRKEIDVVNWWDRAMGVLLAWKIPYIIHWELYCNELAEGASRAGNQSRKAEELRGFWLIRPDGTLSYSAQYLKALLDHAGGTLPSSIRDRWQ